MANQIKEKEEELKPWEQHSAVISIPRFDYSAPSHLLHQSFSGFLVTCPIKREKSATKEVMTILEQFIGSSISSNSEGQKISDECIDAKRRKVGTGEIDVESSNAVESKSTSLSSIDDKLSEGSCMSSVQSDANVGASSVLSLVKLIRSGLLLFTFPKDHSHTVVHTVADIIQSLELGSLKSPLWCHRIFPIQATCRLHEKELRTVVSKLVIRFMNDEGNNIVRPIKFAVGYNRRGFEETEMKVSKATSSDSDALALLDRNKCFTVVAGAVKDAISDSVVDLKCPDLSILVEMLPVSRVPNGSLIVGVSVLPLNLVSTKPKLSIKALVSDMKISSGKKNVKDSTAHE